MWSMFPACMSHWLMASGFKYWHETSARNLQEMGGVINRKSEDWEMFFFLATNTCVLVEQSVFSAVASYGVISGGKSSFLACSPRTDVKWLTRRERCQKSFIGGIITITPGGKAHTEYSRQVLTSTEQTRGPCVQLSDRSQKVGLTPLTGVVTAQPPPTAVLL